MTSKQPTTTAVDLLASFFNEDASDYRQYFEYSDGLRIVDFEIYAVGTESTIARYSGREEPWYVVNNLLRITTEDGFEGLSGVNTYYHGGFSDKHLVKLRDVMAEVVQLNTMDPTEVSSILKEQAGFADEVVASVDIALWDLAARKANQPLYKFFGAKRDVIETYASLPVYDSLGEYMDTVREYASLGYKKFKYHMWGAIEEDLRLVEATQHEFRNSDYRFMVDLEGVYDFDDAMRLGEQMDQGLFFWFEAPVKDELLDECAALRKKLGVQIVPAGYTSYTPEFIQQGIDADAWDAGRFDSTVIGGISHALTLLTIANNGGLPIDIQSWDHTLGQLANLHLMLANDRSQYFETPLPRSAFQFGMKQGITFDNGRAVAPKRPGLGIEVDWDELATAAYYDACNKQF
ncbi:MAG: enolase C-terminal domain-like protein [Pseudomonadota bacterium]